MTDSSSEIARVRCIFYFWGKLSFVCFSFAGVPSPWCGNVWKNPLARNMLLKLLTQRNCQQEVRYSIQHSFSVRGAVGWSACFISLSIHWKDIVSWSCSSCYSQKKLRFVAFSPCLFFWGHLYVCVLVKVEWLPCSRYACLSHLGKQTKNIDDSVHSQAYSFICPIKYSPPNATYLWISNIVIRPINQLVFVHFCIITSKG